MSRASERREARGSQIHTVQTKDEMSPCAATRLRELAVGIHAGPVPVYRGERQLARRRVVLRRQGEGVDSARFSCWFEYLSGSRVGRF